MRYLPRLEKIDHGSKRLLHQRVMRARNKQIEPRS